ncbi:arylsulfatase [Janthinobacterium sp. HLX7-2]|uniref:arylsulfatase n=1 Tax=Janthinobacterium sp. HLX7-2 TaxID=1259331 RepID=UPI003F290EAA
MTTPLPRRHGRKLGAILALSGLAATLSAYGALDVTPTATILAMPATPAAPAAKRPNILYIMADDLGYSDIGAFGGEIETPNLDALARGGRLLTNHHTGTVCAITRSMLISGTDHHLVGEGTMGAPRDERRGLPGYEGYLNDSALSVAQLLKDGGYHTYMAGKWHLGSSIPGGPADQGKTPDQWGFERSYALLPGAARNHFGHEPADSRNYTEDGRYVRPGEPSTPGGSPEAFYSTDFYTKKLISYIDAQRGDGKPFFAYAAYTAPHWPLQVPEPYLSKYKGRYDQGYDVVRAARIARMKTLGIIPADFTPFDGVPDLTARTPASANNDTPQARYVNANHGAKQGYVDHGPGTVNKRWSSLTPLEKKAQARYMEIYAGMVDNLDHNIGLLIQHLKDIGEYDNTFIMFQSDNGAEGWPINSGDDPKVTDEANAQPEAYAQLGRDNGKASAQRLQYGLRWAEVSAAPFRNVKGNFHEGGVSTPLIVRLPGQQQPGATLRDFTFVTDNTATFLDLAGIAAPTQAAPADIDATTGRDRNLGKVVYGTRHVYPITGKSLLPLLQERHAGPVHTAPFGDESYGRAYLFSADGRWKAVWAEPPQGPVSGAWQLFDLHTDRGENYDVAGQHQELTAQLVEQWKTYMRQVGGVEPLRPAGFYGIKFPTDAKEDKKAAAARP